MRLLIHTQHIILCSLFSLNIYLETKVNWALTHSLLSHNEFLSEFIFQLFFGAHDSIEIFIQKNKSRISIEITECQRVSYPVICRTDANALGGPHPCLFVVDLYLTWILSRLFKDSRLQCSSFTAIESGRRHRSKVVFDAKYYYK